MDRAIYELSFSPERVPPWRCPECLNGQLQLIEKSLAKEMTAASERDQQHSDWEPDWIRYVFSCMFRCSNKDCRELVSCCGDGRAELVEYEDEEFGVGQTVDDRLTPLFFNPALVLMDIPTKCPPEVSHHLFQSFKHFFADPGAALNCARAAVEAMLTQLAVKRFIVVKKKRRPISLHQRILALPTKFKAQADLLLAVKWLGNAGSHDGDDPTTTDIRTTYDLLEHVLSEIYDQRTKKLAAVAKTINKTKGRKKKKP